MLQPTILKVRDGILSQFECDDVGEMAEYVGCKFERQQGFIRLMQPVLIQTLSNEFKLPDGHAPRTPAEPNSVLPFLG
jgi:hypothetical protein